MILKLLRNGVGGIMAGVSYAIPVKKVQRSLEEQQKVDEQTKNLELYQFFACPFCIKTRRAIRGLNLKIQTREVSEGNPYREELLKEGGKIQAPCLKIIDGNNIQWMYESSDIINYLTKKYGA